MEMYDKSVMTMARIECIMMMASWTLKRTMIVSLIFPQLTTHNRVSSDVWRSNWSLKTRMKGHKVDMVGRMK